MPHTIEAAEKPVLDIFCDRYVFKIPPYQRPYAWTDKETKELFNDINDACPETGEISTASPYFLGSIVLIKNPLRTEADVVDGQQRLTTLTILLCVLRDLSPPDIADAIHNFVCQAGNPILNAQDVFRITPRPRDAEMFRSAIQQKGATTTLPDLRQFEDAQRNMIANAACLQRRLQQLSDDRRKRLATFIVQRCYLVVVAASDQESAFRIFSVLNSRGLDLTPSDVLKAEIIGALPVHKRDAYTQKWEDMEETLGRERFAELFGHIRMIHRKQKMQETLLAEFRAHVPARAAPAAFITEELAPYAEAFEEITDRTFESYRNAGEINRLLTHLSRLDNFDWQPPAIEMIAKHRADPDLLLRFLTDLERLAYGLFLMRSDTTERIRRYGRLIATIQAKEDMFAPSSALQLTDDDKKAIRAALNGDIYSVTRIRLPLLLRLDEMLAGGAAVYNSSVTTVEHVLPQTPAAESQWLKDFPNVADRDKWVHKLANLVLLTRRKNTQAGNRDFTEKRTGYFTARGGIANFALTSSVIQEEKWNLETLRRRQSNLIGEIEKHWRLN